jgi:hypothetical protein
VTINLLFPTFIWTENYDKHLNFKEKVFSNIQNLCTPDGFSHEFTGHVTLHHTKDFKNFYKFVIENAKKYVETLSIDPDIYEYNVVKSWFNITRKSDNPRHNHCDAHISFSYYINTPSDCKKHIRFYNSSSSKQKNSNELYPGMVEFNATKFDYINSNYWNFDTEEGIIFIFPSSLDHSVVDVNTIKENCEIEENKRTSLDDFKKCRIAIAGDILLNFKNKKSVSLGLQPLKNWRTFE